MYIQLCCLLRKNPRCGNSKFPTLCLVPRRLLGVHKAAMLERPGCPPCGPLPRRTRGRLGDVPTTVWCRLDCRILYPLVAVGMVLFWLDFLRALRPRCDQNVPSDDRDRAFRGHRAAGDQLNNRKIN
jgi:hypothetical protein